jgi:peroxiredoxin
MYKEIVKDGLELLAINAGEPFYKVDNFAKRYNLAFRVLLDEDGEVSDSYGVMGVPTYIFIDKKGYIVSRRHSFSKKIYKDLILD